MQEKEFYKVFTNCTTLHDFVKNKENANYVLTETLEDADIIFMYSPIEDFEAVKDKFINQFPYEACIVDKINLYNLTR